MNTAHRFSFEPGTIGFGLFGFPVRIEWTFWMVTLLMGAMRQPGTLYVAEWTVVVLVSILIHELGHALCSAWYGMKPEIKLYGMGGLTTFTPPEPMPPSKNILIDLGGPIAGFLFAGLIVVAALMLPGWRQSEFGKVVFFDLLWVNVGWGLLNLLPVWPLDGGQVVWELERMFSRKATGIVTEIVSCVVCLALIAVALGTQFRTAVVIILWFGFPNFQALFNRFQQKQEKRLWDQLSEIKGHIENHQPSQAIAQALTLWEQASSEDLKQQVLWLLIDAHFENKTFDDGWLFVLRYKVLFGPLPDYEGAYLVELKQPERAIRILKPEFEKHPQSWATSYYLLALAQLGQVAEVLDLCQNLTPPQEVIRVLALLQTEMFFQGNYADSIKIGKRALEMGGPGNFAYNIACACSKLGELDLGIEWLVKAIDLGFTSPDSFDADPDIESLRQSPGYERVVRALQAAVENPKDD